MTTSHVIHPREKIIRAADTKLKVSEPPFLFIPICANIVVQVIVVGAGLGGLGAAIAILLAAHDVQDLESASEIGEVFLPIPNFHPSLSPSQHIPQNALTKTRNRSEQESKSSPTPPASSKHWACTVCSSPTPPSPSR